MSRRSPGPAGIVSWVVDLQIVLFVIYIPFVRTVPALSASLAQDAHSSLWLIGFYALMIATSALGSFGGMKIIDGPWDSLLAAGIAALVYYWGARAGLPATKVVFDSDDEDPDAATESPSFVAAAAPEPGSA